MGVQEITGFSNNGGWKAGTCTGGLFWRRRPRMDGFGYGAGPGTGSSHHRKMGCRLDFRSVRGVPPTLGEAQRVTLKEAVQELPEAAGIGLANWIWKGVHKLVRERLGIRLSRSGCLNYLHRLGLCSESVPRSACQG